jgi:hypothetical protein
MRLEKHLPVRILDFVMADVVRRVLGQPLSQRPQRTTVFLKRPVD